MVSLDRRVVLSQKHFLYCSAVRVGQRPDVNTALIVYQTWYQVKDHKNCHFDPIHFTFLQVV